MIYAGAILVWLALAVWAGSAGLVAKLVPPQPQLLLLALTLLLILLGRVVSGFRVWVMSLPLRLVIGYHLVRFVGTYFLVLYGRGELPYDFAVPGGIGDIITAAWALGIVVTGNKNRKMLFAWNVLGLLDILGVVGTAARLALSEPGSMNALLHLPLSLLVTFIVPLIIASHILIFVRLARRSSEV